MTNEEMYELRKLMTQVNSLGRKMDDVESKNIISRIVDQLILLEQKLIKEGK